MTSPITARPTAPTDRSAGWLRAGLWLVVLAALLSGIFSGCAFKASSSHRMSSCETGGLVSVDAVPAAARGAAIEISGQAVTARSGAVVVRVDGAPVVRLPLDADGAFQGLVHLPGGAPPGDTRVYLNTDVCDDPQTALFIGDSITEGAFASSREAHYPSLVVGELNRRFGPDAWQPEVYGVEAHGSLLLDDSFRGVLATLGEPLFWERRWWKEADPDLVIIEVGANNFVPGLGDHLDQSNRYDGTRRGYATETEARTWWRTDVTAAVDYLTSQKGVAPGHILILGQWPNGSASIYGRGERYVGGRDEALWNSWNQQMQELANSLGCVFVPMADVYGPAYLPDADRPGGDPAGYIDHTHDDVNIHPNDKGFAMFANRVSSYLPDDLTSQRYRLDIRVANP